ncbi:hypothetical protein RlegTA1_35370 (plasmid) [Rhizobium ruizarguesonis]|jgi:indolepyruvate ferredoxin oxidoreductase|nr:hypothetical protein [Rhizobium ruizarguesonis]UFW99213.1 hypothetical protein RlegTA1_35370 [Rhizobium ruizarguesonis]
MSIHSQPDIPEPKISLDDRYTLERGRILVSGTQALVRLPMIQRQRDLARGLNTAGYVSGYRGSPLAGFDREMARAKKFLDAAHVKFQPGLNEDMAATAVWGTQQTGMFQGLRYDGVFAMWYGKGPGVDRSMDVIRHANAIGTNANGGVLLLVGDDHGAVSSTLPHQSEHNLISAMVPMLSPAGIGEYIDYGLIGWAMSRYSGAWVGFKCQTEIVECSATVDLDPDQPLIVMPNDVFAPDGLSLRWPDGPHAMELRLERKMLAVQAFARANHLDRAIWGATGRARLGIVSTGKSWLDLLGALALLGIDEARAADLGIALYKVGMVWPLEPQGIAEFAARVDELLVVEEKRSILEDQIKAQLFNLPADRRPRVFGKAGENGAPLLQAIGEIGTLSVAKAILSRLSDFDATLEAKARFVDEMALAMEIEATALKREAYFCSGCPHSVSTRLPEGSRASTGIGCHMMIIGNEDRNTSTFTQMGGEGGSWIGLSPFTARSIWAVVTFRNSLAGICAGGFHEEPKEIELFAQSSSESHGKASRVIDLEAYSRLRLHRLTLICQPNDHLALICRITLADDATRSFKTDSCQNSLCWRPPPLVPWCFGGRGNDFAEDYLVLSPLLAPSVTPAECKPYQKWRIRSPRRFGSALGFEPGNR